MEDSDEYILQLPQNEIRIQLAPFWKRTAAYLIDLAIFYFIFFQIFMTVYISATGIPIGDANLLQEYMMFNPEIGVKLATGIVGSSFVFLFYFMVTEVYFGASFGKSIFKIRTTDLSGRNVDYWQSFVRSLTKTVLLPLLAFDIMSILWTNQKQRFSEILAGSKVIYSPQLEVIYKVYR